MITRIEAENYRCFRSLRVNLTEYQVIIGVNGAGKSTLLDIPVVLGEMLSRPIGDVFSHRCYGMDELLHFGKKMESYGEAFVLAIEVALPDDLKAKLEESTRPIDIQFLDCLRWEVLVVVNEHRFLTVDTERLWLIGHGAELEASPRSDGLTDPGSKPGKFQILERTGQSAGIWLSLSASSDNSDRKETAKEQGSEGTLVKRSAPERDASFPVEKDRVAVSNIPIMGELGPAVQWLREVLSRKSVVYDPDPRLLSEPRPGDRPDEVQKDAGNFPWLLWSMQETIGATALDQTNIANTQSESTETSTYIRGNSLQEWLRHVQTALPNISSIVARREHGGRKAYIEVDYNGGDNHHFAVTSNSLSAGTWRLLTLTFLAYQSQPRPLVIGIEEPETALHPLAISTVLDSLRSLYGSQVMVATHAPMVLAKTDIDEIVVLSRDSSGAVTAFRGREHPALATWKKGAPLSVLMASSVLS